MFVLHVPRHPVGALRVLHCPKSPHPLKFGAFDLRFGATDNPEKRISDAPADASPSNSSRGIPNMPDDINPDPSDVTCQTTDVTNVTCHVTDFQISCDGCD